MGRPNWKTDTRKPRPVEGRCAVLGCSNESAIVYYRYGLCDSHWNYYSEHSADRLKSVLKIKDKKKPDKVLDPFEEAMFEEDKTDAS